MAPPRILIAVEEKNGCFELTWRTSKIVPRVMSITGSPYETIEVPQVEPVDEVETRKYLDPAQRDAIVEFISAQFCGSDNPVADWSSKCGEIPH